MGLYNQIKHNVGPLGNDLLLVVRKSDSHNLNIVLDLVVESHDAVPGLVQQVLPLGEIGEGILEGKPLLDLLDLLNALLDLNNDCVVVLSIANPSLLGVLKELQPLLCLHLCVVPSLLG